MELPVLKEVTTKEVDLAGYKLTLRYLTLDDSDFMAKLRLEGMTGAGLDMQLIARLMYGYDKTFEERLKFIQSIEIRTAEDVAHMDEILADVGLVTKEVKETKKK